MNLRILWKRLLSIFMVLMLVATPIISIFASHTERFQVGSIFGREFHFDAAPMEISRDGYDWRDGWIFTVPIGTTITFTYPNLGTIDWWMIGTPSTNIDWSWPPVGGMEWTQLNSSTLQVVLSQIGRYEFNGAEDGYFYVNVVPERIPISTPSPTPTPVATPAPDTITTATIQNPHSAWATEYLERAVALNLIPDSLRDPSVNLTQPITRAEFAGVAVRIYESLGHTVALPTIVDRFVDTRDIDVLKAYNVGIMVGVSDTEFDPNALLNREQAATALTRAFKRATIPGWSFATDYQHPLQFTMPPLFADDAYISGWAREAVYFMTWNGIIMGTGNNMFSPRAVTSAQEAIGYATATREQALIIAVRMIENLQ